MANYEKPVIYGIDSGGNKVPFKISTDGTLSGSSKYLFVEKDEATATNYIGFQAPDGAWYILQLTNTGSTARYVTGASGYTTSWTGRAGLTYGYPAAQTWY